MGIIRLQGKAMAEMKPFLKMIGYQVSDNGNIRAIMTYKHCGWVTPNGELMPEGKKSFIYIPPSQYNMKFSHWLSEDEKERFLQSEYYKTHEPMTNEQLYGKKYLKRQEYLKRKEINKELK